MIREYILQMDIPEDDSLEGIEELVRCKNCKYAEKWNSVYACGKPRGVGTTHEPDWFCADGKRK